MLLSIIILPNKCHKIIQRRNNILKLGGSIYTANTRTFCISSLALVFSTSEYFSTVWMNCSSEQQSSKIDFQLNTAMRDINDTLKSILTEWLPVLFNIAILIRKFFKKALNKI